ncbi:MAG TPA: SUMF1/EgtB/PvdO family nonheme iron enzyme [Thermoanaerobaculia bacterium]|nr:SUMF1/EgtB/PvdO family nonheme iron enzyme [Thermoanaerobaculia bacterium]
MPMEPRLVVIDATWFMMGSDSERDDERPVHRVWVDTFELGACTVTNAEYDIFVQSTFRAAAPHRNDANFDHPDQPVAGVSWFEAVSYCDWLGSVTGRRFRLPTEAEWECAARGGAEGKAYPWGDAPPQSRPGYDSRWINGPERCGGSTPNAYGLYDICENVHEWCSDVYGPDYYAMSPDRNPRGPESGRRRASRGGSWRHRVKISRCAARSSLPPELRYADYGFRIACDRDRR